MTTSLVQLIVPDHLRGRVVSIYMVAFRGGMPLGSLASGYAASFVGVPGRPRDQRRAGLRWSGSTSCYKQPRGQGALIAHQILARILSNLRSQSQILSSQLKSSIRLR